MRHANTLLPGAMELLESVRKYVDGSDGVSKAPKDEPSHELLAVALSPAVRDSSAFQR